MKCIYKRCKYWRKATPKRKERKYKRLNQFTRYLIDDSSYGGCTFPFCKMKG